MGKFILRPNNLHPEIVVVKRDPMFVSSSPDVSVESIRKYQTSVREHVEMIRNQKRK